jgi:ATP-dependent protease ClpP protease subunit
MYKRKEQESCILNNTIDLVKRVDNHIYFYGPVTSKSCMDLNIHIHEICNPKEEKKCENTTAAVKVAEKAPEKYKYIYLHINSFGGSLFACFSTIDTIKNCPLPVISIIEGGSASAATLISVVCDHRIIMSNSHMLIHQLSSGLYGKFEEIKDDYGNCTELMKQLKNIYVNHTKLKEEELDDILKHDVWWNAEKCLEVGLVDVIHNHADKKTVNVKKVKVV